MLIRELQRLPNDYVCAGLVDDDISKAGRKLGGCTVLGTGSQLPDLVQASAATLVLISAPGVRPEDRRRMRCNCEAAKVAYRIVPTLNELLAGYCSEPRRVGVQPADLLGRTPAGFSPRFARDHISARSVLVTGAAGSIGSEICRQLMTHAPRAIIALDLAETPMFELERELRARDSSIPLHFELGNIQNTRRLAGVFNRYTPDLVFHAAAYKHVPLMEQNVTEAAENNVLGTLNVMTAAALSGASRLILISTDKAVRPANVMGATKRMAEHIVHAYHSARTRTSCVRFGNVLGSNGSVLPIFQQQIAAGGPVTVTHPLVERYFMTIPEAVELVLQASALGSGGETFVLDMGTPIRILTLAENLIRLSGLTPHADIAIEFTGLRSGEKLTEELNLDSELTFPTAVPAIRRLRSSVPDLEALQTSLSKLRDACALGDGSGVIRILQSYIHEFSPGAHHISQAQPASDTAALAALCATVACLTPQPEPALT